MWRCGGMLHVAVWHTAPHETGGWLHGPPVLPLAYCVCRSSIMAHSRSQKQDCCVGTLHCHSIDSSMI